MPVEEVKERLHIGSHWMEFILLGVLTPRGRALPPNPPDTSSPWQPPPRVRLSRFDEPGGGVKHDGPPSSSAASSQATPSTVRAVEHPPRVESRNSVLLDLSIFHTRVRVGVREPGLGVVVHAVSEFLSPEGLHARHPGW